MNKDQREGLKEELKGYVNKGIGSITGNEDRKVKGEVQITNGDNRKDLGDQEDSIDRNAIDPGNPSNL
ncbi:hypothetical protein DR64_8264 [Paraburkholderia xenovorans LB400]|uniref:CsbD-like domain-containing protein n=1 Tax=Paraburkholderia xenovorans (strain LB400) TaxID=266265 RepID=Q13IJ9_PARXL|nr:CsbD family protein [Paraburkholderia xenovorans]ABE36090.1 hypothetical protein Bxe_C0165 [Paraburkholderia xenovorans LB400]AIP34649.1 hypothetical protein DR64_8264 [Paraburkholderia xenovorans LB400]